MPTGPVDGNNASDPTQESGEEYWDDSNYDFDDGYDANKPQGNKGKHYGTSNTGYAQSPKNYGAQPGMGGGVSGSGDFGAPNGDQELANFVQNLKQQGYSPEQIQQQVFDQFGTMLGEHEIDYLLNGHQYRDDRGGTKYMGYGNQGVAKQYTGGMGDNDLQQYFQQQEMYNNAKDMARNMKKKGKEQMVKMHMILLLIMMGDVTGALRAYTALMDRDFRQFSRQVMKKLGKVRQARSRVIRNFASKRPPRAYAGDNPQSAARAQDRAQRFTQFVQLSTQLMGELQNTERELVDILQTMKRDLDNHWQAYASMRDNEFRTSERLMTVR